MRDQVYYRTALVCTMFLASFVLYVCCHILWRRATRLISALPISVGVSYILGVTCTVLSALTALHLAGIRVPINWSIVVAQAFEPTIVLIAWSSLYFGIKHYVTVQEQRSRLLASEATARQAQLQALHYQLQPHFLFNTLNSVSSLIRTDPNQARVMVVKLSKVLRRLLRQHETFNALRDELSFIEDYLAIEVVRFGDKLRFQKDVAEDTLDMQVPSMLLQPLVENCIKHGLSSKVEGGTIRIRTERHGDRLRLLVEDDGVGIPETELATLLDRGIGVSNVNERLKVLFGNQYRMWIESPPGNGTRIEIEVPELQTEAAVL